MVMVHGVQDHAHTWDALARSYSGEWHVVAPDLRGHGDSDWNTGMAYRHIDYMYDLLRLIEQRKLAPCVLVAHSMGGAIAAMLAGAFPELVRGLVLLEGIGIWEHAAPQETAAQKLRGWAEQLYGLADRQPRRYPSVEAACARHAGGQPQPAGGRRASSHDTRQPSERGWHLQLEV